MCHLVLVGMNDFVWGLKNGDLDQVIEAVEKVRQEQINLNSHALPPCLLLLFLL